MNRQELIDKAHEAMKNAYSPYSGFKVGAAILTKDGKIFTGCNVENASYGATICAERCAATKAVSEGSNEFTAIAIVSSSDKFTYPCGICRQFLSEFFDENGTLILWDIEEGIKEIPFFETLPNAFTKSCIE